MNTRKVFLHVTSLGFKISIHIHFETGPKLFLIGKGLSRDKSNGHKDAVKDNIHFLNNVLSLLL